MKLLQRFIYFIYFFKKTDKVKFRRFLDFASSQTSLPKRKLLIDTLISTFRYNISPLDYFYFRFYNQNKQERNQWAGTGYMYEYQLRMNPKKSREILENKIQFLNRYKLFTKRAFVDLQQLRADKNLAVQLLNNQSGRIVLKGSHGQIGAEVEIAECDKFTPDSLLQFLKDKGYDLVEEYVIQHPALMELSPSGLNTVRIFTQLHGNRVDFLGARLRISVNSPVDNMAAGNLAAPLDIETGMVNGPAIYSDITKDDTSVHPVTKQPIIGFQVPFWKEIIEMMKQAAILYPDNRSIGWDIAITKEGPELIEGNHNWCKLLWQLPVKKGLKQILEQYYNN